MHLNLKNFTVQSERCLMRKQNSKRAERKNRIIIEIKVSLEATERINTNYPVIK